MLTILLLSAQVSVAEDYVRENQGAIVRELVEALSIPDVAANRANIRKKAELLVGTLERRKLSASLLETEGNPLVFGERKVEGANRTILYYIHYDGQPVNPALWKQESPFKPILRDGRMEDGAREIPGLDKLEKFEPDSRLYARSASDDTSPIIALMAAIDALDHAGTSFTSNVKVVLDGEEEAGSPSLVPAIQRYREKLQGGSHADPGRSDSPFESPDPRLRRPRKPDREPHGLRSEVCAPQRPLRQLGSESRNAARAAARLDERRSGPRRHRRFLRWDSAHARGSENPPGRARRRGRALEALRGLGARPRRREPPGSASVSFPQCPRTRERLRGSAGSHHHSGPRDRRSRRATGEGDGRRGASREDSRARRSPGLSRRRCRPRRRDPGALSEDRAARKPACAKARARTGRRWTIRRRALSRTDSTRILGEEPVRIRTSGGTVPIAPFIEALGFPAVSVPTVNFDNNQHGENENVRLGHFFRSIEILAATLQF